MKSKSIITRAIWILSLVSLFNDIASELLYPVLPAYLKSFGFSFVLIGMLEGLAEITAGLTKGYFGNLSDSSGNRIAFVRGGYFLSAVAKLMLAVSSSIGFVFSARMGDRLGKGLRTAARDAMLADESDSKTRASVFGFHRSMDTVGAAIGPVIAIVYLYFHPGEYMHLFWIAAIPGMIVVSLTFILKEKPRPDFVKPIARPGFFSFIHYWSKSTPGFKYLMWLLLGFSVLNSADIFLLLAIKDKGYTDIQMIGFYVFYNLVYALMAYPIGRWADKWGKRKVLIAGMLLFALVYGSIGLVNNLYIIISLFFLYGIYAACFESTAKALISNNCDYSDKATALGFYSAFSSLSLLVASTWTGWVIHLSGFNTAFLITAVGAVLLIVSLFKKINTIKRSA